jgi:hypothetical protein
MPRSPGKDIAEIFGHSPDDLSEHARSLWSVNACPFVEGPCSKKSHDGSVVYGVCSVRNLNDDEVIVCPNRLYAENYKIIRAVSSDAFGKNVEFCTYSEYVRRRTQKGTVVVALGTKSGREVGLGKQLSIDWVLALLQDGKLEDYAGLEIQSMDITGNYRANWQAYRNLPESKSTRIPPSEHGINWANVHKRLIPQLIRKGAVFSKSQLCTKGLHFALPEIVYQKFEAVVGCLSECTRMAKDTLTVHTYTLGSTVPHGEVRGLKHVRSCRFQLSDFAAGFITGPNLPSGQELDDAIRRVLGL